MFILYIPKSTRVSEHSIQLETGGEDREYGILTISTTLQPNVCFLGYGFYCDSR